VVDSGLIRVYLGVIYVVDRGLIRVYLGVIYVVDTEGRDTLFLVVIKNECKIKN